MRTRAAARRTAGRTASASRRCVRIRSSGSGTRASTRSSGRASTASGLPSAWLHEPRLLAPTERTAPDGARCDGRRSGAGAEVRIGAHTFSMPVEARCLSFRSHRCLVHPDGLAPDSESSPSSVGPSRWPTEQGAGKGPVSRLAEAASRSPRRVFPRDPRRSLIRNELPIGCTRSPLHG